MTMLVIRTVRLLDKLFCGVSTMIPYAPAVSYSYIIISTVYQHCERLFFWAVLSASSSSPKSPSRWQLG